MLISTLERCACSEEWLIYSVIFQCGDLFSLSQHEKITDCFLFRDGTLCSYPPLFIEYPPSLNLSCEFYPSVCELICAISPILSYSLHIVSLWVFVSILIQYKRKLLGCEFNKDVIYEYSIMSLGVI